MVSSISSLSSTAINALFGPLKSVSGTETSALSSSAVPITGYTDDILKTGNAIGNIISIVAGMTKSDGSADSIEVFTMEGAVRKDADDGSYTLTKTGTGRGMRTEWADAPRDPYGLEYANKAAAGTGPEAESARAYVTAVKQGTLEQFDMAQFGVTATMTAYTKYAADGTQLGGGARFDVRGMDQFQNDYFDFSTGTAIFKPTGQYGATSQDGTVFTLTLWGTKTNTSLSS